MHDPINTIDAEQVERNVNDAYKAMHKCVRFFQDIPACQEVALEIKGWIEDFKPYIPLIQALRNPGMRQRHWDQVIILTVFKYQFINQISRTRQNSA